ncbi:DUF3289 family protein [Paenibacillus sp. FSL M7-0420]|uniref:DUF3289 family protein n=1 Tax=Paenibacillus sp. FSL M7-0420 TaxID=2921609 RepID=UPI0030F5742A
MFKKRIMKRSFILFAILVLVFSSLQLRPALAQEDTGGRQEITYTGEGYEVIYTISSKWEGAFNADVTIRNTGYRTLENWSIGFTSPYEITNIWNGQVQAYENGMYTIKNAGSNQDIPVGGSVNFGFTASFEGEVLLPAAFAILGAQQIVPAGQYEASFKVTSDWSSAFNGEIAIKNISHSAIEDWTLEFDYDGKLDRFWTADITSHTGNHYVIHNAGYNANIQPGETLILGFSGSPGNVVSGPAGYQLTQISSRQEAPEPEGVSVQLDTYSLQLQNSPDGDYYFLTSKMDKLTGTLSGTASVTALTYQIEDRNKAVLQQGTIPVSAAWSAEGIGLGIGYNLLKLRAQVQDGTEVTKEYMIVNFDEGNLDNLGIDREKDSDKDGISDYYEEHYGLSATSKDTDGDGLSDRDELLVLKLNPLEPDSDKNGTADGDEDYDKDGLTNLEELLLGTSLISEDSDGDGLTDGEEVHTHKTDPLKADTDGDGLSDAWELKIGSDPLVPEAKFARTVKAEDAGGKAVPSVFVEGITAEQVDSLSVQPVQDGILNDTTIPGYIDQGYNFSIEGSFEKATISFEFDQSLWNQADFAPRIYYYNEESQLFEELPDQQVDGNVVSAGTAHFSRYILLNKTVYDQVWQYKFLYDEGQEHYAGMDIAFVIDSSGSMSDNDRNNVRISVTRQFVDLLTDSDRGAVVDFDDYATVLSGFTSDKAVLSQAAGRIDAYGGTTLSSGIASALSLFAAGGRADVLKYIIMLTDGEGSYDTALTKRAADQGIVIYTVGLGSSISTSVLTSMAQGTGGSYYHASNASQLYGIFDTIAETSDLYKDTDKDGISDYHEKEMQAGRLRVGTGGAAIRLNYLDADSDNDGLKDGQEIRIVKSGDKVYAYLYSNPNLADTDGDGLNDAVDSRRLIPDVEQALILQSNHREGILKTAAQGTSPVSDDLTFNDYTYSELIKLGPVFSVARITPESMIWGEMAVLFAVGKIGATDDMKFVLGDLISTFKYSKTITEGTSVALGDTFDTSKYIKYHNSQLGNAVITDSSTQNYVELIKNYVVQELRSNNGDLSRLKFDPNSSRNLVNNYVNQFPTSPYPVFTEKSNLALSLAIHAFHGQNITIKDFKNIGGQFSGKLVFHFYDHFGLDADDEINNPGFVDWFTLQHYERFNGKYVPFITTIDCELEFSGSVKTF